MVFEGYEAGALLITLLADPREREEVLWAQVHASSAAMHSEIKSASEPNWATAPRPIKPIYAFRRNRTSVGTCGRLIVAYRDRMIAGRMGIGFLKEVVTGQVPAGLKRLSINELAELVRDDARYSEPGLRREIYFRPHSPQRAKRRAPAGGTKSSNPSSSSGESANARSARGTNSPPALERARCVPAGFGPGQASSVAALRHSISGGVRGTGAGSAVDLALSCSACHSMEPRANTVLEGCGLRCSSAAFACRRMSSYKPQLCIWGLSISRAPLQASTSSSWERSGNPSRTRNNSSFQGPRRIFTLPARHCELNGPNLVSLPPFSGAGVAVKPLSARRRRGPLCCDATPAESAPGRCHSRRSTGWRRSRRRSAARRG